MSFARISCAFANREFAINTLKTIGRRLLRSRYDNLVQAHIAARPSRIARVLECTEPPQPIADEEIFARLQASNNPPLKYDYDSLSIWKRGFERAAELIPACSLTLPGARVLEVCCGDGMVSAALLSYGHTPTLLDIDDWRDPRAHACDFVRHDLANPMPLESDSFDAVFSYNAFEHVPNPAQVLSEIVRVTRPNGRIHVDFDPLYLSPWGLHAWRMLKMPYPQLLFTKELVHRQLATLGINDLGKNLTALQPLNQWRLAQFRDLWANSGCEVAALEERTDLRFVGIVEEFPQAFRGRGLKYEDLITTGIKITLVKTAQIVPHQGDTPCAG